MTNSDPINSVLTLYQIDSLPDTTHKEACIARYQNRHLLPYPMVFFGSIRAGKTPKVWFDDLDRIYLNRRFRKQKLLVVVETVLSL